MSQKSQVTAQARSRCRDTEKRVEALSELRVGAFPVGRATVARPDRACFAAPVTVAVAPRGVASLWH